MILEYIEGETLENIQKMRLTIADKYKIIFEIIAIINYFHHHHFVYRDLKPNNVMLDRNKTIILIDLDRMISEDEIANKNEENTTIIIHQYSSPELKEGKLISYSTDIYSLGMLMFYLIFEKEPSISKIEETKCQPILELIKRCTRENPKERPNIIEVLKYFYVEFFSKVRNELIETDVINNIKNIDNDIYIEYLVFICESQNPYSLYQLGDFYRKGNIFKNNLKIAHHYYTLAADKNQVDSQFYLGEYHFDNKCDSEHINKSLYYFTQASNDNYLKAHFYLGLIYLTKIKTNGHIDKAIFYFTLAANQNNAISQHCLGIIYFRDYDLKHFDIKKAIHYFKLSANQNYIKSMIMLGLIYLQGRHVSKDINKAIEYFTQAANKNNINSQMDLGHFYIFGKYVKRDIDKRIYFLSLAANQNLAEAQYELGMIYIKPEYQRQNINKALLYFSLAAKNNHEGAQKALLSFFMGGKNAPHDIEKATSLLSSFTGVDHQTE